LNPPFNAFRKKPLHQFPGKFLGQALFIRFFAPNTSMKQKAQPGHCTNMQTAERLVELANAARRRGKVELPLEFRFGIKCIYNIGGMQLRVFRIDNFNVPGRLYLNPLENPRLDPLHPLFSMEDFRRENPISEGIME
jgi:hypothetical protein